MRAMVYYPMSNGRSIAEFLRLLEAIYTMYDIKPSLVSGVILGKMAWEATKGICLRNCGRKFGRMPLKCAIGIPFHGQG